MSNPGIPYELGLKFVMDGITEVNDCGFMLEKLDDWINYDLEESAVCDVFISWLFFMFELIHIDLVNAYLNNVAAIARALCEHPDPAHLRSGIKVCGSIEQMERNFDDIRKRFEAAAVAA